MGIRLKRAHQPAEKQDGYRVLVDRLWPRGLSKKALALDAWTRDLAPSNELRRWFGHVPKRWQGFVERYRKELSSDQAREMLGDLARRAAEGMVTLVYAARDETHNNAVVLKAEIERRLAGRARSAR